MKRPDRVRVMGKVYSITYIENSDAIESNGVCKNDTLSILIADELPPDEERDTLLHEIVHAVDNQISIGLTEKKVRQIATGLMQVILDNPDVAKFLLNKRRS